jgi:hypothetical protein
MTMSPGLQEELTDAERVEVNTLREELYRLLDGHSLLVNLAALMTAQLCLITEMAPSEQEACETIEDLSETILSNIERVPAVWASLQECRAKDRTRH